jgi:hypothetical protein
MEQSPWQASSRSDRQHPPVNIQSQNHIKTYSISLRSVLILYSHLHLSLLSQELCNFLADVTPHEI